MSLDLQQILVSRKGAKTQRRCLALLLGSQEIFASFAPLREICVGSSNNSLQRSLHQSAGLPESAGGNSGRYRQ